MPKYIFIIFAIFLGLMVFPVQPVLAVDYLVVEFSCGNSTCPIFGVVNFMPGGTATGWAKVTNNSGTAKKIAIEAINKTDTDNLASKIDLLIKEGANTRYDNTLANFFANGETYLSDLANGVQTQYDLTATFNSDAGDSFQEKTLGFDIIIGFQGEEGTGGGGGGGGGGSGGGSAPGLSILEETVVTEIQEASGTIEWTTSYSSTSQVVYGAESENHTLDLSDTLGSPPTYGYAHTTAEFDTSPRVMNHSVTVNGLNPGTTYHFRAISHGSLAISKEYTFTTLALAQTQQPTQPEQTEQTGQQGTIAGASTENATGNTSGGTGGASADQQEQSTAENQLPAEAPATPTAQQTPGGVNPFLAGLGTTLGNIFSSKIFVLFFIIAVIILLILFFPPIKNWLKKKQSN